MRLKYSSVNPMDKPKPGSTGRRVLARVKIFIMKSWDEAHGPQASCLHHGPQASCLHHGPQASCLHYGPQASCLHHGPQASCLHYGPQASCLHYLNPPLRLGVETTSTVVQS